MQYSSEESRRVWASVKALYLKEAPCTPLHRDFLLFQDTAYRPAQQLIVGSTSEVLGPVQFGPFLPSTQLPTPHGKSVTPKHAPGVDQFK
jgi:hypothetical protein